MSRHPARRSQLVVPSGVGALTVFPDGISLMTCGLDHWFSGLAAQYRIDTKDFIIDEWRLRAALGVDHFRLPPDLRESWAFQTETINVGIKIPAARFPLVHACARCNRLTALGPSQKTTPACAHCQRESKRGRLHQVQFIAMCESGHIQDFPWREWVHRSVTPSCLSPVKLFASGGASLLGVHVKCECGEQRNLAGVTDADEEKGTSVLTDRLAKDGARYVCGGNRPWLADTEDCGRPLRGGLRSASNTYFARTMEAIYIPKFVGGVPARLIEALQAPPLGQGLHLLQLAQTPTEKLAAALKQVFPGHLDEFSEAVIAKAIVALRAAGKGDATDRSDPSDLKRPEFKELTRERTETQLKVRITPISKYAPELAGRFADVALIDKLRVTRAFLGFSRIKSSGSSVAVDMAQLRRTVASDHDRWLPASVVFGEGVLLRLDAEQLSAWERRPNVVARAARLQVRHDRAISAGHLEPREISPRFVLLHTLAHALIQRLAFESGYSAASIAERIYSSAEGEMAGVLLYTAAGDSEGTLGGLVRLGGVGRLEPVLRRALERAEWCSADPICMELGEGGGQGPSSCNGAACHNCALLPETACEEFNRYLDRALLIGSPADPSIGFFESYSSN